MGERDRDKDKQRGKDKDRGRKSSRSRDRDRDRDRDRRKDPSPKRSKSRTRKDRDRDRDKDRRDNSRKRKRSRSRSRRREQKSKSRGRSNSGSGGEKHAKKPSEAPPAATTDTSSSAPATTVASAASSNSFGAGKGPGEGASATPLGQPNGTKIQTFEEILQQVRQGSVPMQLPVMSGSALPVGMYRAPQRTIYDHNGNVKGGGPPAWSQRAEIPPPAASPSALAEARAQCRRMETDGLASMRRTGSIPKGPPAYPAGCMVIEQKFVDYIIGPMGQSLAALENAAGVTVHLDQARKYQGYTIANIYGAEDNAKRAKVALDFKISQWLPRGVPQGQSYSMAAPIGAVSPPGEGQPLPPHHHAMQGSQPTSFSDTLMDRKPFTAAAPSSPGASPPSETRSSLPNPAEVTGGIL